MTTFQATLILIGFYLINVVLLLPFALLGYKLIDPSLYYLVNFSYFFATIIQSVALVFIITLIDILRTKQKSNNATVQN